MKKPHLAPFPFPKIARAAVRHGRMKKDLLLGGPVECGGVNQPAMRSVADMPPQMRKVCEALVAGHSVERIARTLDIASSTAHMHIQRAVKRTRVKDREHLIAWCKRGGQVRSAIVKSPYPIITARAADGATMVDIQADSAINALVDRHPGKLLAAAGRLRESMARDRERAATASQDALGRIAGGPEDVEVWGE